MIGRLRRINGIQVLVELPETPDITHLKRNNGYIEVDVDFPDNRTITQRQRKKIFGLINDIAEYTGYPNEYIRVQLTYFFEIEFAIESLSLKQGKATIQQANDFIEFIIRFCFQHSIPFYERQYYLDSDSSKLLYYYTMNRRCFICGKSHADIHHFETLGMGRDRRKYDHSQNRFMTLCQEHHHEINQIGRNAFCDKYIIQPIKLKKEDLEQLGLGKKI